MHYSFFSRIRDILLLGSLFFLVKAAYERTFSFIKLHKDSVIHELDRNIIDQIYTAQRQLHFLQEHPVYADTFALAIADIKEQLAFIEEKYKKNSPGLALLGPIGSTAIVVKEEQLQIKLLNVINDLHKILASIDHQSGDTVNPLTEISGNNSENPTQMIDNILNANKQILKTLITT